MIIINIYIGINANKLNIEYDMSKLCNYFENRNIAKKVFQLFNIEEYEYDIYLNIMKEKMNKFWINDEEFTLSEEVP